MMKSTYGTGCFALLNTGETPVASNNRLLTTIAYQLDGKRTYALEGAIFIAGAAVQWLRDALKMIGDAPRRERAGGRADPAEQVYLVPAFVGLGAPWWDAECARRDLRADAQCRRRRARARGAGSGRLPDARPARGDARRLAGAPADTVLRVDGGMTASDWTMQFLADILAAPVDRPAVMETTALGAAYLAGLAAGLCPGSRRASRRAGPASAASCRRWTKPRASANGQAGGTRWRGP